MRGRRGFSMFTLQLCFFFIEPSMWPSTVNRRPSHWGQDEIVFICRQHFQMHFCNEIKRISVNSSLKISSQQSSSQKVSLGAGNGLVSNLNQRWLNMLIRICFTRPQRVNHPWIFSSFFQLLYSKIVNGWSLCIWCIWMFTGNNKIFILSYLTGCPFRCIL